MVGLMAEEALVVGQGVFIDILDLETALLEEPVLETCHNFVHVHFLVNIEVEEVVRADEIEVFAQWHGTRDVGTPADGPPVLAFKVFAVNIESL